MAINIPQSLIDAIKNNNLIPFVGAGISMGIKDKENNPIFKSWTNSLLDAVQILKDENENAKATRIQSGLEISPVDYLSIASEIHKYLNSHWNSFLTKTFERNFNTIDENSLNIAKEILKINNLVITTNYDNVLKWACENKNDLIEWGQKAIHGQIGSLKKIPDNQTIWYLHGKISNPDDIVFTKESYEKTYKENSGAIEVLKYHLLTKSFIFCGFSLDDPYIKMQLEKLKDIFGTNLSKHFLIVKKGQKQDFSFLGDIHFLEVDDYEESYLKLLQQINDLTIASTTQQTFNAPIHIQTTPKTPFFNVPFESKKDDFVGIEGKLEDILSKLTQSKKLSIGQVAKFEGMGGLGKTQLAVEYAHEYKEFYPNGVVWLTMDQNLDEQLLTFAKQYNLVNQNLDIKEQLHSAKYQFKSFENMLFIYDNTNGLEDIEQDFLPKSPTNQILITTRNPIQGYTSIELQTLDLENSKKLLEIESGKPISEEEIGFVKELCEQLDGLPLALEMAGAYVKYLDLSWENYLNLYTKQNIELLNKSTLPESFTKHENNIANTLTISQKIIDDTPRLKEILQLLSYGANEPIDDELIKKLLSCGDTDIIEAISIGIKLKYIKKSAQGYTIHRLLKEVWKTQEQLDDRFIDEVAKNLSNYISEIKDEFLNLSKLEIANLFSEQWINYLADNDTKAMLMAYKAYVDFYKGNYVQALMIVEEANTIIEKKDSNEYAEILAYFGSLHSELGDKPTAKDFYEKSFEMINKLYPNQDHPDIIFAMINLSTLLCQNP
ncbi:SIR2 family protein, partial [Sulfuricurvum sp.]|uniref:SIR2 family protein n=1 Tax=Sulfuricurvum sp. TaxID=2025608 RepID=UPI0025EB9C9E